MSELGERVKQARVNKGMSQLSLAKAIGRKQQLISGIEQGVKGVPSEQLKKIAEVLDVSVSYLMGEVNVPKIKEKVRYRNFSGDFSSENESVTNEALIIEKDGLRIEIPKGTSDKLVLKIINDVRGGGKKTKT